ncbi:MAG TPA: hypothetical protein DCZ56_01855 [Sutterella sp.]|nr:hypothetical protein [Sutterella sp.]
MLFALCCLVTGATAADAPLGQKRAAAAVPAQPAGTPPRKSAVRAKDKSRKFHSVSAATRKVKKQVKMSGAK